MLSSKVSSILSGTATGWYQYRKWALNKTLEVFQAASRRLHRTLALKDFFFGKAHTRLLAKKTNRVWNPGKLLLVEEKHRLAEENSEWMLAASGVEVEHFWESIQNHGWTFPMQCVEPAGSWNLKSSPSKFQVWLQGPWWWYSKYQKAVKYAQNNLGQAFLINKSLFPKVSTFSLWHVSILILWTRKPGGLSKRGAGDASTAMQVECFFCFKKGWMRNEKG